MSHSQGNLYVKPSCPACGPVMSYMKNAPPALREAFHMHNVQFENKPSAVTQVPTLMLRSGETLVGDEVYQYLKRWRKDAGTPHTKHHELWEGFDFNASELFTMKNVLKLILILILLYALYYVWNRQTNASSSNLNQVAATYLF